MNAGKVKTFRHLGLHDTLYRNRPLGRKFLEKISNDWPSLGAKSRSPYGNSFFGQSLFHIQLLKNAYGIKKRSFLKQLTFKSKDRRGVKSKNLLNLLENKLDYFLFNSGYVTTLTRAKELIETGNIKVNGELVRNSGYILKPTDKVSLRGLNPLIAGETKHNVISGFSMTTRWSFYKELLEDTMLLEVTKQPLNKYLEVTKQPANFEVLETDLYSLKNLVVKGLDALVLSENETFSLGTGFVSGKEKHLSLFLGENPISRKYLSNISYLLKKEKSILENKNTRMQKYLAENYLDYRNSEALERYVTMALVFSDLSLLKPVWEDCMDQNTSDLSTDLTLENITIEKSITNEYTSNHFVVDSSESFVDSGQEESVTEDQDVTLEFTVPQDEELDLTEELEEIRETADYYSQMEIDVVENRAPYMESYAKTRNLYCQYIQSVFLTEAVLKENASTNNNSICGDCSCEVENHEDGGPVLTESESTNISLTPNEVFAISDHYLDLLLLENDLFLEDVLLSSDSMAQSVILRDKKEGTRFNLVSRSPEVTGENFYLDPELWELRSRLCEDFSESKTNSAEHVIKATR